MCKALEESIKKWKKVVSREVQTLGPKGCPLCDSYHKNGCVGCPVMDRTGIDCCSGTPYEEWEGYWANFLLWEGEEEGLVYNDETELFAQKELKFLVSLRKKGCADR